MSAYWFGTFVPDRVLLDAGIVTIYWYSILVVCGIVAAAIIARTRYLRSGGSEQLFVDGVFYAIIGGLIGARLWHVFVFHWDYYRHASAEIIRIWEGGIAIQGALIGGAVALWWFTRRKKIGFIQMADSFAVGIPLGQAIGRWGNFFNQELYGLPTSLPWGIYIAPENRVIGFEQYTHFHPAFFYESVLNGVLFLVLLAVAHHKPHPGMLICIYVLGYSVVRFAVDYFRIDPMLVLGPLRTSQVVALLAALSAVIIMLLLRRRTVPASK